MKESILKRGNRHKLHHDVDVATTPPSVHSIPKNASGSKWPSHRSSPHLIVPFLLPGLLELKLLMYVLLTRHSLLLLRLLLRPVVAASSVRSLKVASVAVTIDISLPVFAIALGTVLTGSRLRPMAVIVFGLLVVHLRVFYVIDTFGMRWLLCLLLLVLLLLLLMIA